MKIAGQVKPISYFKAHAPEVIRGVTDDRTPVVITLRGEAKAVLQDIESFEQTQETLALLKILALTNKNVEAGKVRPVTAAFTGLRDRAKG